MATNLVFNAIAPEALKNDNYSNWSVCVKSYLLGQDLWDIIKTVPSFGNEAIDNSWKKKNAMALHAIQISCGPDMLSEIREIEIAKDAWDTLAEMHEPQTQGVNEPRSSSGDEDGDRVQYIPLLKAVDSGDLDAVKSFLLQNSDAVRARISAAGMTALHVAAFAGHVKIVEELVKLMSEQDLEIQEAAGYTALSGAARAGITQMAECMVKKNEKLVSIGIYKNGAIPVALASVYGHKDILRYLYKVTPLEQLTGENETNGATVVVNCIISRMFGKSMHACN